MRTIESDNKSATALLLKDPPFAITLLYIIVWFIQLGERWAEKTGGLRIEALVAGILLVFVFLTLSSKKKMDRDKAGFTPYVLLYLAVLLLQVVNSWDSERSWFFFTERVLKYSLLALFISHFTRSTDQLKLVIFAVLLAWLKITQEGVWGGITGSLVWENQGIPRLHGSTELYGHPNSLSQLALGALPFIYYLYPLIKKKWLKIGIILLLVCAVYCIIYTGSRTGYLGAACMLALIFWKASRKNKNRLILSFLILLPLLFIFTPDDYKGRFSSTFSGQEEEGRSKEGRIKMYGEAWTIFTKHPFGVGVGNYPLANAKYYRYHQEVHCLYLEVLTHLGIQGFVVFMLLLWKIYSTLRKVEQRIIRLMANEKEHGQRVERLDQLMLLQSTTYAVLVYFVLRLFVDIFGMDLYGICWWFTIGMVSALTFIVSNLEREGEQMDKKGDL